MNVTTTNTGDLNAVLRVEIEPQDYREKVEKTLRDYRKRANIPGFRPGKVPNSLIKKQYGKAVLIDEVNHLLQHAVYDHIRDEKLDILGNPIPVPNDNIDWENQESFSFDFELGLTPEFEVKVDEKTKVPYYKIEADKTMIDRYVKDYASRYGSMKYPDEVGEDSIVKVIFTEVDKEANVVAEGIRHEGSFSMDSLDSKKAKKALTGKKIGDKEVLELKKAFKEEFNLANLLDTDEESLKASTGRFELDIVEISKLVPAEVNQELFDKVYGEGEVSSEEEFRQRIKEEAEKMFVGESDRKFMEDLKEKVLDKAKFDLPDDFLKKWLRTSQEKPVSEEQIEEEYPALKESMKWQLVENKVMRENDIEVGQEEIEEYTQQLVARQMMQYGQQPDPENLKEIGKRVLENKDEAQRITDQLVSEKLMRHFKETVKLEVKKLSFDEFLKKLGKN